MSTDPRPVTPWPAWVIAFADELKRAHASCFANDTPTMERIVGALTVVAYNTAEPEMSRNLRTLTHAVQICASRDGKTFRKTMPKHDHNAPETTGTARALWRHWQFAIGANVNLGGLFSARYEAGETLDTMADTLVDALVNIARGTNVGAQRWKRAMHG